MSAPVPANRGRYVVTLHRRHFAAGTWLTSGIAELSDARSRQLVTQLNQPAEFRFTISGASPQALLIAELQTDVIVRRWSTDLGADVVIFRGVIDHAEDQLTEQEHTVNVVAHSYDAMLARRFYTLARTFTQTDQDQLVADFVNHAVAATAANGQTFNPGSYLPLVAANLNPDGTTRTTASAQLRDRTYAAGQELLQALTDLALVINGFDFYVVPADEDDLADRLGVFFPAAGVSRPEVVLMYGSTVAGVTRTTDSGSYANFERVNGNGIFAERWLPESNNVTQTPIGLWMSQDNASDVSVQATVNDKAQGDVNLAGLLLPSYTLTLAPDVYRWGRPALGDVCRLIIKHGRLAVDTAPPTGGVRVLGIEYDLSDDGAEDVKLTVGRPALDLYNLLTRADRDVDALTRR